MSKQFTRKAIAIAVATGIQIGAGQVLALDNDMSLMLEEVVVTAQKREQSLQEVPSTVNAIQGDALTDLKLFNFTDLEQVTPGLDMRGIDGRAGSIALRGVDFNPNSAAAQAVDVYWNDATLGSNASGGVFQQLFDLGRVEVLRGPQGTLQGRSSPGGAVAIHTARPNMDEVDGFARTTFTENSGNNTQFGTSLPIIPGVLAVRVAGVYDESEKDEIKNVLDGNVTDAQTQAGRLTVSWAPTDTLNMDLVHQYVENNQDNLINLQGSSALGQALPDLDADDRSSINQAPDRLNGRYEYTALNMDWEVAGHQVTFVSGYSEVASRRSFDNAPGNSNANGFTLGQLTPTALIPTVAFADPQAMIDQNYASSQELRLTSLDNEFWDYTVGIYYGSESGYFNREQTFSQNINAGPLAGTTALFAGVVRTPFNIQDKGVFAHNIFHLTDALTGQLGIRWQSTDRHTESVVYSLQDVTAAPFAPSVPLAAEGEAVRVLLSDDQQDFSGEEVTGSASLSYTFDDPDLTAYINVGSSYRPGGVTVSAANLVDLSTFDEEKSWAVEVGLKSTLWDDRLRLNAALFHQDFDSYIYRVNRILINRDGNAANQGTASITVNGDAEVQGLEVDFEALMSENWHMRGGVSYVEAQFKDGAQVPCNDGNPIPSGTVANTCDFGGVELGSQPRFSASVSTDYTVPFDAFEGYVQLLYKFTGRRTEVDATSGDLGGYGTADLHLGVREGGGSWDVSLFARNLFDKQAIDNMQPEFRTLTSAGTGYLRADVIPQRQIGVSAAYNF